MSILNKSCQYHKITLNVIKLEYLIYFDLLNALLDKMANIIKSTTFASASLRVFITDTLYIFTIIKFSARFLLIFPTL